MAKRKWNPSQHPRDSKGRFTKSATKVMTSADRTAAARGLEGFNPAKLGDAAAVQSWMQQNASTAQGGALEAYFAGGWRETNPAVRRTKPPKEPAELAAYQEQMKNAAEIDGQMRPLGADVMLRRQVPLKLFAGVPLEDLVGMKMKDAAYWSAKPDTKGEPSAAGAVTLHIAAPAGTRGFVNAPDGEVLLARDSEMAITRVEPNSAGGWDMYGVMIVKAPARGRGRDEQRQPVADAPAGTVPDAPPADTTTPAPTPTPDAPDAPPADEPTDTGRQAAEPAEQPVDQPAEPDPFDDETPDAALAAMTPADRQRVQIAVEDHGPTYFASPLIGGDREDVIRYVADSNLDDVQATYGRRATWDAVAAVVNGNPGLLTRTPDEREKVRAERRAEAQRLSSQAAAAMQAGDFDAALGLIDDGEATEPDFRTPGRVGRSWAELRAVVSRRAEAARAEQDNTTDDDEQAPADAPTSPSPASNEDGNGEVDQPEADAAPAAVVPEAVVSAFLADPDSLATSDQVEAAIRAGMDNFNDPASGLTATISTISVRQRGVRIKFQLTGADGQKLGTAKRVFRHDTQTGISYVEHSELELDTSVQGTGFGARFNARNEEFYRAQGFTETRLTANLDVGGYAWARAGYDWEDNHSANVMALVLRGELGDSPYGDELTSGAGSWPDEVKAQARALVDRTLSAAKDKDGEALPGEDMPTPLEFAMLGWTPGTGGGKAAMWPGKQFMLGRSWGGRRPLDSAAARPGTAPDRNAPTAPTPAPVADVPAAPETPAAPAPAPAPAAAAAPVRDPRWDGATLGQDAWYSAPGINQASIGLAGSARRGGRRYRLSDRRRMENAATAYSHSPQSDPALNYVTINAAAFTAEGLNPDAPEDMKTLVDDLQNLIGGSPLYRDIVVHRGIQDPVTAIPGWPGDGDATGLEWRNPRFMSTSAEADQADQFARGELSGGGEAPEPTVLRMLVPRGTGGLQLSPNVWEVLLGRDHTLRVVADNGRDEGGVRRLDVELVPSRPDAPAEPAGPELTGDTTAGTGLPDAGTDIPQTRDAPAAADVEQLDIAGGTSAFADAPRSALGMADRPQVGRTPAMADNQQLGLFASDAGQLQGQGTLLDALLTIPAEAPPAPAATSPDRPSIADLTAEPASVVPDADTLAGYSDEQLAGILVELTRDGAPDDPDGMARLDAEWTARDRAMQQLIDSVPDDLTALSDEDVQDLFLRLTADPGMVNSSQVRRLGEDLDRRDAEYAAARETAEKRALLARDVATLSEDELVTAMDYAAELDDDAAIQRIYDRWGQLEADEQRERDEREAARQAEIAAAAEAERAAAEEATRVEAARVAEAEAEQTNEMSDFLNELMAAVGKRREFEEIADEETARFGAAEVARMLADKDLQPTPEQQATFGQMTDRQVLDTYYGSGGWASDPAKRNLELHIAADVETKRRQALKLAQQESSETRKLRRKLLAEEPIGLTDAELAQVPLLLASLDGPRADRLRDIRLPEVAAEADRRAAAADALAAAKAAGPAQQARLVSPTKALRDIERYVDPTERGTGRNEVEWARFLDAKRRVLGLDESADARAIKAAWRKSDRPYPELARETVSWYRHLGTFDEQLVADREAGKFDKRPWDSWKWGGDDDPDIPDNYERVDAAYPANVDKPVDVWAKLQDQAVADRKAGDERAALRFVMANARAHGIPFDRDVATLDELFAQLKDQTPLGDSTYTEVQMAARRIAEYRRLASEDGVDPADVWRYGPPDKPSKDGRAKRAQRSALTPRQQARLDAQIARGSDYLEAYADVIGVDVDELRREQAGLSGPKSAKEVRAAYDEWTYLAYIQAEKDTRANLLSRKGVADGVDPKILFSGPISKARPYASEELLRWWEENPRLTYAEFRAQLTGGARAARNARLSAGAGRDFV